MLFGVVPGLERNETDNSCQISAESTHANVKALGGAAPNGGGNGHHGSPQPNQKTHPPNKTCQSGLVDDEVRRFFVITSNEAHPLLNADRV